MSRSLTVEDLVPLARARAWQAAKRYNLPFEEILSDALLGLTLADKRCAKGAALAPFADSYIHGQILKGIRDRSPNRPGGRHGMPRPGKGGKYRPVHRFVSFDYPESDGAPELTSVVPGSDLSPQAHVEIAELWRVVDKLPTRQGLIIRLRFQWDLNQAQIAEVLGLSQMQISRLLAQALKRLRILLQGTEGTVADLQGGS